MTELDDLMHLDPLELSSQNIDEIIAHMRRMRATGAKPKKAEAVETNQTSLAKLGLAPQGPRLVRRA